MQNGCNAKAALLCQLIALGGVPRTLTFCHPVTLFNRPARLKLVSSDSASQKLPLSQIWEFTESVPIVRTYLQFVPLQFPNTAWLPIPGKRQISKTLILFINLAPAVGIEPTTN